MFTYNLKRPREKEEHDSDGLTVHEKKKHRSLPLRASPYINSNLSFFKNNETTLQVGVSTLTPTESSEDDNDHGPFDGKSRSCLKQAECHQAQSTLQSARLSTEMDVDSGNNINVGFPDERCNERSQQSPIPPRIINRSLTISEQRAMRMAREAVPSAVGHADDMENSHSVYLARRQTLDDLYTDRNTAWWRDQRLPSPISDADAMIISSKYSVSDADMTYTTSRPASPSLGQTSTMFANMRELDSSRVSLAAGVSSPNKVAFSMGYRSDCDKCRRKVPGHYSHIIRC
ncbi:uncharacterized protein BP01DRAFT_344990 [Aspergillus saccharolyticus JOP 1030-1]|uniref:Uncharacterized protein n=1 Tax=Aspergillus saccharolyticus JOP 1030-1 TaxID=1450539 RepID=A0A318ZAD5_9EURO|nr:hypothetical protein BP01DRAFT_344990 [Aspergillus saccharolyticus JOP 1030-1]PYH43417.1 hypothetical protein BP01DRAFT_344990 [Aspergillus saccharolyticus JOP 1030-1]